MQPMPGTKTCEGPAWVRCSEALHPLAACGSLIKRGPAHSRCSPSCAPAVVRQAMGRGLGALKRRVAPAGSRWIPDPKRTCAQALGSGAAFTLPCASLRPPTQSSSMLRWWPIKKKKIGNNKSSKIATTIRNHDILIKNKRNSGVGRAWHQQGKGCWFDPYEVSKYIF